MSTHTATPSKPPVAPAAVEPQVQVGFRFRLCGEVFRIVALTKRGIACRRVKEVAG